MSLPRAFSGVAVAMLAAALASGCGSNGHSFVGKPHVDAGDAGLDGAAGNDGAAGSSGAGGAAGTAGTGGTAGTAGATDAGGAGGADAGCPANGVICGGQCCSYANATATCSNGACAMGACDAGYADCNADPTDGCEVQVDSDTANCGSCGNACVTPHATAACTAGVCGIATCDTGYTDCNNDPTDGCEADTSNDIMNCGTCSNVCPATGGAPVCNSGTCGISACTPGTGECDGDPSTPCETNLQSDPNNCGYCGNACNLPNAGSQCSAGQCTITSCNTGYADCDTLPANGCEVNLDSSVNNCGACGTACTNPNGQTACVSAACSPTCNTGYGDCDGDATNGCETDTATDPVNCGTCGNVCNSTNGTPSCVGGACKITCAAGWGDCDGDPSNGCETKLDTSTNCGACGTSCSPANATGSCSTGQCTITSCNTGYADCNGNAADGCEVSTQNDANNCGGCNTACSCPNGTPSCVSGTCGCSSCAAGTADCDGNAANGCEVNTNTDVNNCGGCGTMCNSTNGTPICNGGTCAITCAAGFGDCNNSVTDGCETSLTTNTNCGACGASCSPTNGTGSCSTGTCTVVSCSSGYADCNGSATDGCEVNIASDPAHCGSCTTSCSSASGTATCTSGTCGIACSTGYGDCNNNAADGCETNLNTSTANCGTCGAACNSTNGTASCSGGSCSITCNSGYGDCNNNAADGCEAALTTNTNCGACGSSCSPTNGTGSCSTGSCTVVSCSAGYADCNGSATDGCEVNIASDPTHCGSCGTACSSAGGTATCTSGTCGIVCSNGYGDCNNNAADGCETNLNTSTANCGACGTTCSNANGTTTCSSGTCSPTCNAGYADCDSNPANGCETNLKQNVNNCGACGTVCSCPNGTPNCLNGSCGCSSCAAGTADCDGKSNNGCETNTNTDVNNCGGCGNVCNSTNGTASCSGGTCSITCNAGWADCNNNAADGCETPLNTLTDCSTCGASCSLSNATASCSTGSCQIASCNSGYANCDGNTANGCETSTNTDVNNCGGCNTACSCPNGTPSCTNGACGCATCNAGTADCDGLVSNGCEVNTNTSTSNCGGCGNICNSTNGTATCTSGTCGIVCSSGYGNCNNNAADGCETALTSLTNCGTCGTSCSLSNATATCSTGSCQIGTCNSGYANCDGTTANGCETSTNADVNNCGGCGNVCTCPNGTPSCTNGACGCSACNAGTADCDGLVSNGCEVNTNTDTSNCGGCGTVCNSTNGTPSCSSGSCSITCNAGYGNCNGSAADGCETALNTLTNCGTCGTSCSLSNATATCSTGSCQVSSCNSGYGNCDGNAANGCETNTNTSTSNCGGCGTVCNSTNGTASCSAGACGITCNAGYGDCNNSAADGCEAQLNTNTNCGSCGTACSLPNSTTSCSTGSCKFVSCNSGYGDCNNNTADGCEASLSTTTNCGACGTSCSNLHGTTTCSSGACAPTCSSGYGDCDSNTNNGCETSLTTLTNCGSCGSSCSLANATASCSTGTCAVSSCNSGYANCDGTNSNGCEVYTQTDVNNCGACGSQCSSNNGTPSCSLGACGIACNANWGNCDGDAKTNGCETDLLTSQNNCGSCGHACSASQTCVNGACQSSGAVCGDGVVQTGEQCDDGNTLNLDGCSSTCKYEQIQRITQLTVSRSTAPSYCAVTTNAFGKSLSSSAASSFNSSLQTDVDNGVLDTMFDFQNLDDLTGQNDASLGVGVVNGSLDARAGTWNPPGAIDWWFLANASDVDSSGLPVHTLSPSAISNYVLTGGPNTIVMQYSQWPLTLLNANLKANIGTTDSQPAPPPQASQLASGLVTFETMDASTSGLGLCGNVTVGSLAAVPAPSQICVGGSNACISGTNSYQYTYCSSGTVGPNCNSLLDVLVGGCKVKVFFTITVITPTQPDVGVGGNPPNTLTNSGTYHKVTVSQPNDAYSSYFQFQSQRAHITNNLP